MSTILELRLNILESVESLKLRIDDMFIYVSRSHMSYA